MAKLYPSKQTFVDIGNGVQILVSPVKILTSSSDHLDVAGADDVSLLKGSYRDTTPTFYLSSDKNVVAIDGATVGTEYTILTRHSGMVNTKINT